MNRILLLICLIIATLSLPPKYEAEKVEEEWENFKAKFSKEYDDDHEEEVAHQNFRKNYEKLVYNQSDSDSYAKKFYSAFGVTKFFDINYYEWENRYANKSRDWHHECQNKMNVSDVQILPETLDYRDYGIISRIKDQKKCNAGWAFSAITVVESAYAIHRAAKVEQFSEQQLIDCDTKNSGCKNGIESDGIEYLVRVGASPATYKFTGRENDCQRREYPQTKLPFKGCVYLNSENNTQIKKALVKYGPLAVRIDKECIFSYHSGIIEQQEDRSGSSADYMANIVGYDNEKGREFWIVRTSFGILFGESGYIKIAIGDHDCGIYYRVSGVELEK